MAGGLSGDGDGDITDELVPTGKNSYLSKFYAPAIIIMYNI